MAIQYLSTNVWDEAKARLRRLFTDFDHVIITFSGGKDSGALLNLCLLVGSKHGWPARVDLFHQDYEAQWTGTTEYVDATLSALPPNVHVWRACVPIKAGNAMTEPKGYWRPWAREDWKLWCRPKPSCHGVKAFPFYTPLLTDYGFQRKFSVWLHGICGAKKTAVLVGVRGAESLARRAAVTRADRREEGMWEGLRWTVQIAPDVFNAYPLWDWQVEDVWAAHARQGWSYNRVYDAFRLIGIAPYAQRTSSPYHAQALSQLPLYRILDPEAWEKIRKRVPGVEEALAQPTKRNATPAKKRADAIAKKWSSI